MKQIKVVYIVSGIDKAVAFEWITTYLNKDRFKLQFILLEPGPTALEKFLTENSITVNRVICSGKMAWPAATITLVRLLRYIRPQVVHCHLLDANILGLTAATICCIKKRIYTRHHSSQHHVYHPKGVWWDKLCNQLATKIIAISGVVYNILTKWEGVPLQKVQLIPHGFDFASFMQISEERIQAVRERMNLLNSVPVIGVASRFTPPKGVNYIIEAFVQIQKAYPGTVLLLLNAKGSDAVNIYRQLAQLPTHAYRLVPFEPDMAAAYKAMNVFVHVPVDAHSEAFGQVYVEALAAGVPAVFSISGIAHDFILHNENARVVPHKDAGAIAAEVLWLLRNPKVGKRLSAKGCSDVQKLFPVSEMIHALEHLYAS